MPASPWAALQPLEATRDSQQEADPGSPQFLLSKSILISKRLDIGEVNQETYFASLINSGRPDSRLLALKCCY